MSDNMDIKPSPGLNMEHGFIKKIEQHQIQRGQQVLDCCTSPQAKEDARHRSEAVRLARRVGMPAKSSKPTLEIYRPPGASENSIRSKTQPKGLRNLESKSLMPSPSASVTNGIEFSPTYKLDAECATASPPAAITGNCLSSSPSKNGGNTSCGFSGGGDYISSLAPLSPSSNVGQCTGINSEDNEVISGNDSPNPSAINLMAGITAPVDGASDADASTPTNIISYSNIFEQDTAGFSKDIQTLLKQALEDPSVLSVQQLSEVGRILCTRVVEDMKYYKTAAGLCSHIIQKESRLVFLGTVISCCQEWYLDRDKLRLHNIALWVSYIRFLSEMFSFLRGRNKDAQILANLILECFLHMLKPSSLSLNNFHELECLDSILFSQGRDLQIENPGKMKELMTILRDCFLELTIQSWARKILLQLIELQASGWELSPTAIKYYFDGSCD